MIQRHVAMDRRTVVGLMLGLWVVLLAFLALRLHAAGPQWGLHLSEVSADGRVVAASVGADNLAWELLIRPGDEITSVDSQPATAFAGQDIPSSVRQVAFAGALGTDTAHF